MDISRVEEIKKELAKHGSFDAPDFHFRWEALEKRPYRGFVDEALTHFYIKDDTDLNQGGCFVYTILADSRPQWMIQLSMVGRYGVLFRFEGSRPSLFKNDTPLTPSEELILKLVAKHEIVLLNKETLMPPWP
ncbi:MAG TPA: hypothetical protein VMZ52_03640 [Bryobacteraceae bacterium]|nr:hypothetical protein [Bryobacteraceae bacterium]